MTNEQKNVPELRFPEFKGEWVRKKLKNIASFGKGKSLSKKDISKEGHPCILYGELYTKYDPITTKVYSKTNKLDKKLVYSEKNQVLIPSSGETDIDIATATCINISEKIIIGGDLNIITPKIADGRFISLYINGKGKYNLAKYAQGKSVVHLYNSDIKKLEFFLPKEISEQEKIGNFFSKLDRQIELEEQKLELLKQQKKGYMQKIFSQEIKFKDENGNDYPEWIEKTIEEVTKYISSKKSSNQYIENNTLGSYPVYDAIQEIAKDSQYDMEEPYISILKDGAGVGRLNLRAGKSSVIGTMGYLLPKYIDIQFLYYRMKLLEFKKYIIGSTIPHLYYKDYSKEKLKIPSSSDEQKKIGTSLKKLDDYIEKQSSKVEFLKQRKQGLLQKMFI
ncbi:restriction endonuclease subunit S [Staphylococcus lugdunensis]|uniref:Restriction endonuclease subunit S n=1 Tax=Staphylococcus lugdunensis TaxID=28035 RepID=A0ABX6BQA7_STALU|nr:restriction endonuclease subunit S [Staphylococcus lugdunensis]ARJ29008.1 restriction endonuclease subunit S [Staphylococcus lugdunensis]MDK7949841.1 restriction endonuclease subunit S [Staphylococcus lugdunensis]MDU6245835.1 restriction endonuclease subunit S [Staphylococcus lugdunensis]QEX37453.1 restriction endonuclease subunit S [Staphylococcus lugdunensis]